MKHKIMRMKRSAWLLRAAIAGSVLGVQGGTALAQEEGQSADARGLEEVIVTAQRREENIQSVPVAITAFDNNTLREQNISSPLDLNGRVPGVTVGNGGQQRNGEVVTIRGQGQTYLSPVGVVNYFAEVPLIQSSILANQGGSGTFWDLSSLQVLRGPQGTLFGRNTTGGAVLLGPKKPAEEFSGYVQAQGGDYDDQEYEGAVNVPLIEDRLMVRLSYRDVERDGFTEDVGPQAFGYDDVCQPMAAALPCGPFGSHPRSPGYKGTDYDNKDYWHARIGVLWRPTDSIENYFVAYQSDSKDNGTGFIFSGAGPGNNLANLTGNMAYDFTKLLNPATIFDPTVTQNILAVQQRLGARKTAMNIDQSTEIEADGYINTTSIELSDNITFRNIIGYQTMKVNYNWDLDGSILPMLSQSNPVGAADTAVANDPFSKPGQRGSITDQSLLTEEAQIQGTLLDEQLDFVTGYYYSKQQPEGFQGTGSFNAATLNPGYGYEIETTSQAIYAQGTLHLGLLSDSLEKFNVTLGVRRTEDEEDGARFGPNFYTDRVYTAYPDTYTIPARTATLNSDEPTWTAGLDYQMNDAVLIYGKVTRGYKAGSFNYAGVSQLTSKPELVTNYEIGAKTDFTLGDMPARVNANLFSLDYEDIQRAAGDNLGIGSFQPNASGRLVCVGPNGEDFSDSTTCLDQGAIVFNADSATIEGIELEFLIQPTENLEISANYSYVDAQYDSYDLVQYPDPLKGGTTLRDCNGLVTVPSLGQPAAVLDLSCIPFQNTPEDTAALNVRYLLPLGDGIGEVVLLGSVNYRGKVYGGATMHPDDEPRGWVDAYHVFNLSAEWNGIMGSSFDARAFVDNVADDTYVLANYTGYASSSGFTNDMYGEPRMWGVSLRYRFGAEGE